MIDYYLAYAGKNGARPQALQRVAWWRLFMAKTQTSRERYSVIIGKLHETSTALFSFRRILISRETDFCLR